MSVNSVTVKPKDTPLWLIAFTILLPTSFAMLATSATNVAIPHIAGFFGSTLDEANWVITSYMIANAILIPLTGWLENLLGRNKFLKLFIALFTFGSIICAFAHSLNMMVLGRLVQGIGGGPMMPISQAILIAAFPFEKRGQAMALFAFAVMVFSIMGPTFGGYIVDNLSWQWIYLVNIPVGIFSIILIHCNVKDQENRVIPKKVDIVGLISLTIWLLTMQVVLDKGQQYDWFGTPWVCILTAISVFSFIFFIVWELECDSETAVVNLRVFKDKNFFIGTVLGSSVNMIIYVTIVLLPQFLQRMMGYTATLGGMSLAPRVLSCIVMLVLIGPMVEKIDNRILVSTGFLFLAISTIMYANLNLSISFGYVIIPNILMGIGVIMTFIPISGLVLATLPKSELSNGAGLHSLAKCVTTAFVISLSSTLVARLSQVHQTYLVENVSPFNPIFQQRVSALAHKFMSGYSVFANHKAQAMMYLSLQEQSRLMAYVDVFEIFALIAFFLIPWAFFLKIKKHN